MMWWLLLTSSSSFFSFSDPLTACPAFFFLPRTTPYLLRYHCLNGWASIWMMAFLTRVFVRTSSLLEALYTTSRRRTFRVQFSDPHAKLPLSRRRARYFLFPPRQRTVRTRFSPNLQSATGLPISYLRFFWWMLRLPPVFRCLWRESREMPILACPSVTTAAWGWDDQPCLEP